MRVYVESYGCQMNVADADLMRGVMHEAGIGPADGPGDADVILVNTCAVREHAEERVFGRLTQLLAYKHKNPNVLLGVTGCMAEHLKERILDRVPFMDLVVGPDAYRRLPDLVREAGFGDPRVDVRLDKDEVYDGLSRAPQAGGITGFVTVQRGCDKFCTFCVVPFTRGRERGVSPREVLRQVRAMAEAGYREVTLLGQTVNSYRYEEASFADLLRVVAQVPGIERIRFTSPYPVDFDDALITVLAEVPEVMPFVHLPVQSGADSVLDRMRRGHTIDEYRELVGKLRDRVPGLALSTDIIVGFSGETEAEFAATVALLEEIRYDSAFLFKYSERDLAKAAKALPDDVPESVKGQRLRQVIELQEATSRAVYASRVGAQVQVLVTGPSKKDPADLTGRARDFKTTIVRDSADRLSPGDRVTATVTGASGHTLIAEATGSTRARR